MSEVQTIRFKKWTCKPVLKYYSQGRVALILVGAENGEPIAVATVNLPEYDLPKDHLLIKDWSENEGMYDALLEAGYITESVGTVSTGFVQAIEVEMTDKLKQFLPPN